MRRFGLVTLVFSVLVVFGSVAVMADELQYEAKKATGPVVVDGSLGEWAGLPSLSLTLPDGGKATLQAQWDEKGLYFAVVVEDKEHSNSMSGVNIWQGDNVQISLDTLNNKSAGSYDSDDFEFGWALTDSGLDSFAWHTSSDVTYDQANAHFAVARVASTDVGSLTVYEIAIPLEQLKPAQFKAGAIMGFDWLVNDNDGNGREFVEWTPGIGYSKDPSSYGSLILAE